MENVKGKMENKQMKDASLILTYFKSSIIRCNLNPIVANTIPIFLVSVKRKAGLVLPYFANIDFQKLMHKNSNKIVFLHPNDFYKRFNLPNWL